MQAVDLAQHLLAESWVDLASQKATGTLRLERGNVKKSLAFLDGGVVGAESTLPRESLTAQLVEAGELTDDDAQRANAAVAQRGCAEAAALAGLKLVEPARLLEAMRERIASCAVEALSWQSGDAHFDLEAQPGADARRLRCDALDLAHRAASLHLNAERLAGPLIDAGPRYATLAEGRDAQLRSWIADDAVALRVLRGLDGSHPFELAVGAAYQEPRALAALWIAQRAGDLEFADTPVSDAEENPEASEAAEVAPDIEIEIVDSGPPAKPAPAARPEVKSAAPSAPPGASTVEVEEIRKTVTELHQKVGDNNHYEMLGVVPDASAGAIKKAYFKAAKRFHPDKLARLGLEDVRDAAAEVFAALAEASEVLSDPARRKTYDERLAGGGAADDVDIARLTQAEGFFRKSEVLVKMGDFRGAAELLETAVQLWPEESEYHAALGFARFKKSPRDLDGARSALEVAINLRSENAQAHMWLSLVLTAAGDVNASAQHAAQARTLDPTLT